MKVNMKINTTISILGSPLQWLQQVWAVGSLAETVENRPSVGVTPCVREGHTIHKQSLLSSFRAFTQREQRQQICSRFYNQIHTNNTFIPKLWFDQQLFTQDSAYQQKLQCQNRSLVPPICHTVFVSNHCFLLQRKMKNLHNKPNESHDVINGEVESMLANLFFPLLPSADTNWYSVLQHTHGRSACLSQTSGLNQEKQCIFNTLLQTSEF